LLEARRVVRAFRSGLAWALRGTTFGAMIAWVSCGTISCLCVTIGRMIDPEPDELVHPFLFAANVGAVFLGAPAGFILGQVHGILRAENHREPPRS
jgi:hypothetical protein